MSMGKKGNPEMGTENTGGERPTLLMRLALRQERERAAGQRRLSRLLVAATVLVGGAVAASVAAYAYFTATGSGTGEARATSVSNLTITATGSPTNKLYPGAAGDVVLQISNPNSFPVTITAVSLPSATTYATGYGAFNGGTFSNPISGCTSDTGANPSYVSWNFASNSNPHTLSSSLTVGATSTLTVTMTNDAFMGTSAPALCAGAYFSIPALAGITATSSTSTATTSPATDSWTS